MNSLTGTLLVCTLLAFGDFHLAFGQTVGSHLWSKRFGSGGIDLAEATATDGSGNVVVTGWFGSTMDFGGESFINAGLGDIFVAKFSATDGTHVWSRGFGGASWDTGESVAIDKEGNVFVTGPFGGTVDFGGGPLTSAGGQDIFLVKLSGIDGAHLWSKRFGGASDDWGIDVTVDSSGNVIVTGGVWEGTVDFGGGSLSSAGFGDVFVAKFSGNDGSHMWSKVFGSASRESSNDVVVSSSGDVFVTGWFSGSVNFGGGPLTSAGEYDVFVVKLSAAGGAHLWSKRFGGGDFDLAEAAATDESGNVIVTGWFRSAAVDFGGGSLTSAGDDDIFVAALSGVDGSHLWSKRFGSTGADRGLATAVDRSGNWAVAGSFDGTVDFGGGPLSSAGNEDIFVAEFSGANGAHLWSKRFGDADGDFAWGLTFDPGGNVVAAGEFRGTVDFGGGPLTSAGETDIFVLKLQGIGGKRRLAQVTSE